MTPVDLRKNMARERELEPLFKSYLFLYLSQQTGDWSTIKYTIGVLKIIRFGGYPARVPDVLISELRQRENELGIHETKSDYRPGDLVTVRAGAPLAYCQGIFQKSAGQRVYLLMDILGKETEICMKRRNIEPTG
jgi:transcriptional antiterminator RfaH